MHRNTGCKEYFKYRSSRLFMIFMFMFLFVGCSVSGPSSVAQTSITSNTVVINFASALVTAGQIDSMEKARFQALVSQGLYDNSSGDKRKIEIYSFTQIFDKIELAKLLKQYKMSNVDILARQVVPLKRNIRQSEAHLFYLSHPTLFSRSSPLIHIREIVVHDEKLASQLLNQLHMGNSFAQLAQEYSVDPQSYRDHGGDLGWIARKQMPTSWENVAFALVPNQISTVFQMGNSYYILQMVGKPSYYLIPYAQVSPSVSVVEALYVQQQQFLKWLSEKIVYEPIFILKQAYSQAVWATISNLQTYPDQGLSE